jgi:hypothetical protein
MVFRLLPKLAFIFVVLARTVPCVDWIRGATRKSFACHVLEGSRRRFSFALIGSWYCCFCAKGFQSVDLLQVLASLGAD